MESMRWKELSLTRKLKSHIRSKKLAETHRKRLQIDSAVGSNRNVDYIHQSQAKILTRKQVDKIKSKSGGVV